MNQLTLSGKPTQETGTSSVLTPETTTTPKPSLEKHYTEEDLFKIIATDMHIFDIRCWQNGITKQEFFKRWNNDFPSSSIADSDENWWNAGHFAHVLRELKNADAIDPEIIWEAFLQHKDKHLREQVKSWKQNAEWEFKVASNSRTAEDCEQWISYAKRCWGDMNRCLWELRKPEVPIPESYSSIYPDPMYWRDPIDKKPEHNKKETNQGGQES